ncbi:MAG TPA: hypothetical protein VER04_00385, partial [Polyangiaceae bacterium]|nr:hypothetical protein [Polyangiaceae bacterium]
LSQQQLFSVLRAQHVRHLGEVERVYLEACGAFSVLRRATPVSGLSVLPSPVAVPHASDERVCSYCGQRAPSRPSEKERCDNCQHAAWTEPVAVEPRAES